MPKMVQKMLSYASFAKPKNPRKPIYKFIPKTAAAFLISTAVSLIGADLKGSNIPQINLLPEYCPIGGSGNNLQNPNFDPVPGRAEIALAPLNFAPKTSNELVDGPNPRFISNVIAVALEQTVRTRKRPTLLLQRGSTSSVSSSIMISISKRLYRPPLRSISPFRKKIRFFAGGQVSR
jgi:hypothetical protein